MRENRGWALVAFLFLLAACAPRPTVELRPAPGVKVTVPVEAPAPAPTGATAVESGKKGGARAPVIKVLPGNPLPEPGTVLTDDFAKYPTGAVLPVVAPERYGLLRHGEWQKIAVVEAFDPSGRLDKAVRLEGGYGEGFLTTGAVDWSNYEVRLRIKVEKAPTGGSAVRFRLFLSGAGDRALELKISQDGLRLDKLAGEQRFTLIDRRELADTGRSFLRDQNWHDLRFALEESGRVRFWLDGTLLLEWTDPDYRAGGFGVGPTDTTFFLDDLEIRRLGDAAEGSAAPRPGDYCGYRAGEPPSSGIFRPAAAEVELRLLGGHSAARDYRIGYYPAGRPETATFVLSYAGAFDPATCLNPPPAARFSPEGPFGIVHAYEHYGKKRIYTEARFNEPPRGFRGYRALEAEGDPAGILLLAEDWVDGDYDDLGLLLVGAAPAGS